MTAAFHRYLTLLGTEKHPSGLDGLRHLIGRHLSVIPFENVSKLLLYGRERAGRVTTLSEFLDGIEFSDLGGTCYTNNPFFASLLRELGYDADLLGADMSRPNVHTCIRVRTDGLVFHVDVGFAAPFREPMPLDRLPLRIEEGGNHYILTRQAPGDELQMTLFSGAERIVGYVAHGPRRPRNFFDPAVLESFALSSTFMRSLRISRIFPGFSLDLTDRRLYRHEAGKTTVTELANLGELKAAVQNELGMPRCPVESAIAVLEQVTGKPFFGSASGE